MKVVYIAIDEIQIIVVVKLFNTILHTIRSKLVATIPDKSTQARLTSI